MNKMKKFSVALLVCVISALASTANAGMADTGTVSLLYGFSSNVFLFTTSGTRSSAPGCAGAAQRFAIDTSTAAGKSQMSIVLLAYSLGKPIKVYGNGYCSVYSDSETVDYLHTAD